MRRLLLVLTLASCGKAGETPFIVPADDVDGDGVTAPDDCNDFDAHVQPGMAEICNNGLDDDCNGDLDCDDSSCDGSALCVPPENCDDQVDNDGNGQTDCDDAACLSSPVCQDCDPTTTLICGQTLAATIGTGSSSLNGYSCGSPAAGGVEISYAFTAATAGTVRFTADPADPFIGIGGLDVSTYVLAGACRVDECAGASNTGALGIAEVVELSVEAGDSLYFIVERVGGLSEGVDLNVTCL